MFDLAIVGAGANGISLAKHLEDFYYSNTNKKLKIALIGPEKNFSKGKAFGEANTYHKVNTPPSMLAITAYEPHNFTKFLMQTTGSASTYPPRQSFAQYISNTLDGIRERKILNITEIKSECFDINQNGDILNLHMGNKVISAKKAVLCLGVVSYTNFPEFDINNSFYKDFSGVESINNSDVIIAGTGLTSIDFFRILDKSKKTE